MAWVRHNSGYRDYLVACLFGIVCLAARWPYIAGGEALIHSDEAIVGIMADDILNGRDTPLYFYGQRYMGALEPYAIAGLRFLGTQPHVALRLGPALFLSVLVGVQYLMLSRWFGRLSACFGSATLIACSPMFMQWSVAARGAYIEVMLWGCLLWWAYGEWCVQRVPTSKQLFVIGLLVGSGLWLNPTIIAFIAPVVVHWLLQTPLEVARYRFKLLFARVDRFLPRWPVIMPLAVLGLCLLASFVACVDVSESGVERRLLSNLVPPTIAKVVIGCALAIPCALLVLSRQRRDGVRAWMQSHSSLIFGVVIGQMPVMLYIILRRTQGLPLEDCLPLGFRSVHTVSTTAEFAFWGLPLFFGADPNPLFHFLVIGQPQRLQMWSDSGFSIVSVVNVTALSVCVILSWLFVRQHHQQMFEMLRLRSASYQPPAFFALAVLGFLGLYLINGCSFNFTSIRYFVPMWVAIPGLMAALVAGSKARVFTASLLVALMACWTIGQFGLITQLDSTHPMQRVAEQYRRTFNAAEAEELEPSSNVLFAETLDAHLLSYFSGQEIKTLEFRPFWSRLVHYDVPAKPARTRYLVRVSRMGIPAWRWPGPEPVELNRTLRTELLRELSDRPENVRRRVPLGHGYEIWELQTPLDSGPDTQIPTSGAVFHHRGLGNVPHG